VKIIQLATYKPSATITPQGTNQVKQRAKVLTGKGVMSAAKKMANRQAVVLQNKKGKKGEDRNTEPEETDELDKDEEDGDGEEERGEDE
jgi:hypothetical protein